MIHTPIYWNGTTFRSQLELRWARFLDAIDVAFVYESMRRHYKLFDFDLCGTTIICEARSAINLYSTRKEADEILFPLLDGKHDLAILPGSVLRWHYQCSAYAFPQIGWIRMRCNRPLFSDTTWSDLLTFEYDDGRVGFFRSCDPGIDLLSGETLPQGRGAFGLPMRRHNLWKLWNDLAKPPTDQEKKPAKETTPTLFTWSASRVVRNKP